jgi:hypothetical protein
LKDETYCYIYDVGLEEFLIGYNWILFDLNCIEDVPEDEISMVVSHLCQKLDQGDFLALIKVLNLTANFDKSDFCAWRIQPGDELPWGVNANTAATVLMTAAKRMPEMPGEVMSIPTAVLRLLKYLLESAQVEETIRAHMAYELVYGTAILLPTDEDFVAIQNSLKDSIDMSLVSPYQRARLHNVGRHFDA